MIARVHRKTVLDNGLRVVSQQLPHLRSVSVSLFLGAGSRYEGDEAAGASHFIEHLCFKGTQKRPSAKEISEAIEGIGGIINGGTDKELSVYWSKVALPHFHLALDVVADMVLHPRLDPADVDKERQVIIEEINMSWDSPAHLVSLLIDDLLWPGQPLGRDVAGTKESVSSSTRESLVSFMRRHYVPGNAVLSVAGNLEHEGVVEAVAATFGQWPNGALPTGFPTDNRQESPRLRVVNKPTEQAHICLALRGLPSLHPDRPALELLNAVLGEGMSSRLFLHIREQLGLAYDIHSSVTFLSDTGDWVVYAGVPPERLPATLEAVLQELHRLKEVIPQEEANRAREFLKGRLLLRMEDSRNVSGWLGAQELLLGRIFTEAEVIAQLDAVTPEDMQRVAEALIRPEKLSLAVVGPVTEGQVRPYLGG